MHRPRSVVVGSAVAMVVLGSVLVSCTPARAGARCRPEQAWGQDATWVLQCRRGRWQRVITKADYARILASRNRAAVAGVWVAAPAGALAPATGPAFQVVYVVGADATPDPSMPAALDHELSLVRGWFAGQTGGRSPRMVRDTAGHVAVWTVRVAETTSGLASVPAPFSALQSELSGLGLPAAGDGVLVYAAFAAPSACGEGIAGTGLVWLGTLGCQGPPSPTTPWFGAGATFAAAHELVHALGAVQPCAPHWDGTGHVDDSPADIVWGGQHLDTAHVVLDVGRDDYYGTGRSGCDIATSPFWEAAAEPMAPPSA
jgi:hypothetical protein